MKLFGGSAGARRAGKAGAPRLVDFFNKKWVRIVTVVLAVIGTGIIGGATWWKLNIVPPEIPEQPEIRDRSPLPTFDIVRTPRPIENDNPDLPPRDLRKDGVYTFILLGRENDGNTDTIMVGMLDTEEKTFNIISIPRDTLVNVNRNVKKINAAYGLGEMTGRGNGILQFKGEIETLIGYVPDFYAVVNYRGFIRIVDTIGGVNFNVPTDMYKVTDDMVIDLRKGQQKLSGYQALQLVRFRDYTGREGYGNDDFGRMAVNQEFLRAMGRQAISLGNLFKIGEFVKIAEENLLTDLSVESMIWIATTVLDFGIDCLNFYTLPTESVRYNRGWYERVLIDEALELINSTINPFVREMEAEDLDIFVVQQ
jgi:LCP family protein required for cell wall assembly